MSRHPLDDLFKERLSRRREPVPEGLWDGIAARRGAARRKRRALRWMYGGGGFLLIALCSLAYFYQDTSEPTNQSAAEQPAAVPHIASPAAASTPATSAPAATERTVTEPTETVTPTIDVAAEAPSLRNAAARARRKRQLSTENAQPNTPTDVAEETDVRRWLRGGRTQNETAGSTAGADADHVGDPPITPTPEPGHPADRRGPDYAPRTPEDSGVSGPHRRSSRQSTSVQTLAPRSIKPQSQKAEPRTRRVASLRCYDISRQRWRYQLEGLAGPALGRQVLSARVDEAQRHLQDRRSTEKARPGFGGGLRFSMVSPRGFAVRSGIYYTELRNRFEYEMPGESSTIITERYDPQGNVIGVDTTFTTEQIMYATTNRLQMLELPLLAGYEFQWNRLRVALTAGGHFNVWFDARGQLLSPNSRTATDFGQVGEDKVFPIYTRQAGVGLYAGAALLYHLGGRYSLVCEPFVKSYPRSLTRSEYVLRENYWLAGLQMGVRARL